MNGKKQSIKGWVTPDLTTNNKMHPEFKNKSGTPLDWNVTSSLCIYTKIRLGSSIFCARRLDRRFE